MRRHLLASVGLAMAGLVTVAHAAPPPAEAFGRVPNIEDIDISPNGRRIAIFGGPDGQRAVSVATIDETDMPSFPIGDIEPISILWADDDHVIARIATWRKVDARHNYRFERNLAINPSTKAQTWLLNNDEASIYLVEQPIVQVTPGPPLRVIVEGLVFSTGASTSINTKLQRKGVDSPFLHALWSVDPVTGRGRLLERGTYDTVGWRVGMDGQPRVRLDIDEINHRFSLLGRPKGGVNYQTLWNGPLDSISKFHGFSDTEDAVYLMEGDQLTRRNLTTGVVEKVGQPDVRHPYLTFDPNTDAPVTLRSGDDDPTWLDKELGGLHASLQKVFRDRFVNLYDWSADRNRVIVRVNAASSAPEWYLFDKARKELSPLGADYPELKGVALGTTRTFQYKARDGLDIQAYLTLPPGAAAANAKAPVIVLPHGGPQSRDTLDFDFIVQFLATRGYAVLQPQFRGSTGFGEAFREAGRGEWGGKMQTDLLDAVAAAAAKGDIDPARACIVGASFGGYAAMAGAAFHSDDYRCAAAIAGVADLGLLLGESVNLYGKDSAAQEQLRAMLGQSSSQKLAQTSPAQHAANIKIPLLLIHGDQDTVVPPEQSEMMVKAMKAAGRPVEYVVLAGENHYLTKSATRTQMLKSLDAFLAKNLPVTP